MCTAAKCVALAYFIDCVFVHVFNIFNFVFLLQWPLTNAKGSVTIKSIYELSLKEPADETTRICEAALVVVAAECATVDKNCKRKLNNLFKTHIEKMENEEETPSLVQFKQLIEDESTAKIAKQVQKDLSSFYERWTVDIKQFFDDVVNSGIFPIDRVIDDMTEEDVDKLIAKKLQREMKLFKRDVTKCFDDNTKDDKDSDGDVKGDDEDIDEDDDDDGEKKGKRKQKDKRKAKNKKRNSKRKSKGKNGAKKGQEGDKLVEKESCYAQAYAGLKKKIAALYKEAKKYEIYGEFTAYIARAHFGLRQTHTTDEQLYESIDALVKHNEKYYWTRFKDVYNELVDAETRAYKLGTCDMWITYDIRNRMEDLQESAQKCLQNEDEKSQTNCLDGLVKEWRKTYAKDMANIDELECHGTFLRYTMIDVRFMLDFHTDLPELLKNFAKTNLYWGVATMKKYYKMFDEMTFERKKNKGYYDGCSLPELIKVKEFVTSEENHEAVLKCNAMPAGQERDDCFNAFAWKYRRFFRKFVQTIRKKKCKLLRYYEHLFELIKDLGCPVNESGSANDYEGLAKGFMRLEEYVQEKKNQDKSVS